MSDNAIDTITCVRGNSCSDEGMPQCNDDGVVFRLLVGEAPKGLADMPDDVDALYTLRRSCGRVYHDQTTVLTNTALVVKIVDVKEVLWLNPCASTTNSWVSRQPRTAHAHQDMGCSITLSAGSSGRDHAKTSGGTNGSNQGPGPC